MTLFLTTPPRKLAIVGASARAAAFSALRAGFEVVTADLFADADLARHCPATRINDYPEGLAAWLAATDCDAWIYTGGLENYPDLVDRMATMRPLMGNHAASLRDVRDPFKLQDLCRTIGANFPETCASPGGLHWDGTWLCKTYRGASGSGVWRLDGQAACDRATAAGSVLQRFVAGTPAAAIFVVGCNQAHLMGVTQQIIARRGPAPWQYVGSQGPLRLAPEVTRQLQSFGDAMRGYGVRGLVGVDLVLNERGAWIIEINPRYTASVEIVERFSFAPLISAHVAACTDSASRFEATVTRLTSLRAPGDLQFGKKILLARHDVRISRRAFEWMDREAASDPLSCRLADVPRAGEMIPTGRPVATVFAEGESADDFLHCLALRVAEVEQRLYDG